MHIIIHTVIYDSITLVPISQYSMMFAAWLVDPLALAVVKAVVDFLFGKLFMNAEMSKPSTLRPSSARIFTAVGSVTTNSLPSPGMWSYTPFSIADRSVLLPWKPPPTIRVTPSGMPMPDTRPAFGSSNSQCRDGGDAKGRHSVGLPGVSTAPLPLGSREPLRTKAQSRRLPESLVFAIPMVPLNTVKMLRNCF